MSADTGVKTITLKYEAFGRGDIACYRGAGNTVQTDVVLRG